MNRSIRQAVLLAVFACATVLCVALPASAGAFGVANFNYTNSTTQAAGHPNATLSFERTGGENEDVKDVILDLPPGVFPNAEAGNPKCTSTQFGNDACPDSSQVGSITTAVTVAGLIPLTISGSVDILDADPNQAATLGITLRPPLSVCLLPGICIGPKKIFLKIAVTVRSFSDAGLHNVSPNAPAQAITQVPLVLTTLNAPVDITIKSMSLTFQSRANATATGPYFFSNTTSCLPAQAAVELVSSQNVHATGTKSFNPTGCDKVPFDPSVNFSVANPNAGERSQVSFTLNVPQEDAAIQNAQPKVVDVDFPNGSGIAVDELATVGECTEAQLSSNTCPSNSVIGVVSATAPPLPPDATGKVYAMTGIGTQVPIAVRVEAARNTVAFLRGTLGSRGDANVGTGRVYSRIDRIPQFPVSRFTLTFTKALYKNPDDCGTKTASAELTGYNGTPATNGNGTVVTRTSSYDVVNCAAAPETTITNGPPPTTSVNTPTFEFSSSVAGSTFQCRFDTDAYQLCASPFTALPLANGAHTFSVYAVNGLTPDPTPAEYSFTVATAGYSIAATATPSTSQAAAHPDLHSQIDMSNGQPKTVSIKLPSGFNASLSAASACASAVALAGNCAAASKVGSVEITVDTFSGPQTGVGDAFLTDGPTGGDAGGLAVKVPLGAGTFIAQGGANVVNNGNNENLDLRSIPTTVGSTAITLRQIKLDLSGANRFLTNPSNCTTNDGFVANSVAYDGSSAPPVVVPFQATGCASVPFNPAVNQTLSNPTAGQLTGVVASVDVPIDNSGIKTLKVVEPPVLGPNFPSFGDAGDMCPSSSAATPTAVFNPASCPAQSQVGTMSITTPLLPFALSGTVHLINKSPLPWLGVRFDNPGITVRLTGVTSLPQVDPTCDAQNDPSGFCQSQISALFNNLPDVPLSHVSFTLDGPSRTGLSGPLPGQLLAVSSPGDTTCVPSSPAKSTITPQRGAPVTNLTQNISVSGC
jgi:hypothetical protein